MPRRLFTISTFFLIAFAAFSTVLAADPVVRGRVVQAGGAPVAEAKVYLLSPRDPASSLDVAARIDAAAAKARTDAEGRFVLPPVPTGLWIVRVEADGFVPRQGTLAPLLNDAWLPDAKLALAREASVRVLDAEGAPVADAVLRLSSEASGRRRFQRRWWRHADREAVTDDEGRAVLALAPGESPKLTASHPAQGFATVDGLRGGRTLRFESTPWRTLTVREAEGTPLVGGALRRDDHILGVTDAEGRVRLPWPDEAVEWTLAAPQGRTASKRFESPADAETLDWSLPSTASLGGRLIDAESRRAVAGAIVWPTGRPERALETDARGGFEWTALEAGTIEIEAGADGFLRDRPTRVTDAERARGLVLALRPAATVVGRVETADGSGIEGAALSLERKPTPGRMEFRIGGRPQRTRSVTDEHGRFRLNGVDPERSWILGVQADAYAPATTELVGLEPYRTKKDVVVVLERGGRIAGRVVDEDGAPISGASLRASRASEGGGPMARMMSRGAPPVQRETWADEDGRFELEALPTGRFDVKAASKGFAPRTVPGIEIGDESEPPELTIELAPGERLQGLVLGLDEQPLEGAKIFLQEDGGGRFRMRGMGGNSDEEPDTIAGVDGWFSLFDLSADAPVSLRVERSGYVPEDLERVALPQKDFLVVNLSPSSTVRGTAVDSEGTPVANASVELSRSSNMSMGGAVMMMRSQEDTSSDADGAFVFEDVRPGSLSFKAVASGYKEAALNDVELEAGTDLEDLVLRLDPGATLTGTVRLPDGRPAIGARVDRVREGGGFMRGMSGVSTDGAGRYVLDGLEPGDHSIEATHPEYPRAVRDVELKPGPNGLDLDLEGGQPVRGVVLSDEGKAVAGARVDLVEPGRFWGGFGAETGVDGTFSVDGVKDGRYGVRVAASGYASSDPDLEIEVAGQPVEGLDLRLTRGGALVGSVEGVSEEDYARIDLQAIHQEGRGFLGGTVDFEGRFRIENAAEGRWELRGSIRESGRRAEAEVVLEPGAPEATVVLTFGGGLTLTGRARQGETPVRGAVVALEGVDVPDNAWTETDNDGRFVLEGVEAGEYKLSLRQWDTGMTYTETLNLDGDRDLDLDIPTALVEGRVRDAVDGSPIAGVSLVLEGDASGAARIFGGYGASSDQEGSFKIRNVTDGRWTLSAKLEGYAVATRTIDVANGRAPDDLDVRLDPTEGLVLRVVSPAGTPPDRVRLAVLDDFGRSLLQGEYDTGENGKLRLPSVPAGTWEVLLQAAGSATMSVRLNAPGPETPVALTTACSLSIAVPDLETNAGVATATLTDAEGRAFRSLAWFGSPESEFRVDGGRLEIRTLPPGQWNVTVSSADGRSWAGAVAVTPGAPAALTLETR